jgi:hypothetical protein
LVVSTALGAGVLTRRGSGFESLSAHLATEAYALDMSFDGTTVALHWLAADAAAEDRDE